jgi:hypothetical protein
MLFTVYCKCFVYHINSYYVIFLATFRALTEVDLFSCIVDNWVGGFKNGLDFCSCGWQNGWHAY